LFGAVAVILLRALNSISLQVKELNGRTTSFPWEVGGALRYPFAVPIRLPKTDRVERDAALEGVTRATEIISQSESWESRMETVLEVLGQALGVDRAYVFQVEDLGGVECVSQRFEWCRAGIPRQIDNPELQRAPIVEGGFERWGTVLRIREPVYGDIADFPASEQAILEPQGIKSLLAQPIHTGAIWWGFLGLDSCVMTQTWKRHEVDKVRIVAAILGATIHRQRYEAELLRAQRYQALGRVAGGIGQEFKNVLTTIGGVVDLMKVQGGGNAAVIPAQARYGAMVEQALERARGLSARLLEFSRRRAGESKLCALPELLEREAPLLRSVLRASVQLRIESAEGRVASAPVCIDPAEFSQIILHLAENAHDAMPAGGVMVLEVTTIDATDEQVASDQLPAGRWTVLRVRDTGKGMLPEVLARAFEPFFTTKVNTPGAGLGLATVQSIVRAAGGHVRVSSTVGQGTEFRIYLRAITN
jgi:signal transduction histidine kinase